MPSERDRVEAAAAGARRTPTGWLRVNCPLCLDSTGTKDTRSSLAIDISSGRYMCWRCDSRGTIKLDDGPRTAEAAVSAAPPKMEPPPGFEPLTAGRRWSTALSHVGPIRYLLSRLGNRAGTLAAEVGIGVCATGKQAGRIIVPILDLDQKTWLGWVGRDWTGKSRLKYVYPPGMTRVLFNRAAIEQPEVEYILVVEGVFDALACWSDVVACLGKPSRWQTEILKQCPHPIVVALDGDAWEEGWALAQQLRFGGRAAGAVRLPPRTDPATVPREWLHKEAIRSLN